MTRSQADEERIVSLGRAGMAPSAAERARVRASLTHALVALGDAGNVPASSAGELGCAASSPSAPLAVAKLWATRALTVALLGGGGYWAGYRAGRSAPSANASHTETPVARAAPVASVATSSNPEPTTVAAPVASESPKPARSSSAARRVEPPQPSIPEVPVDEELRTLRRAEHALRQGNPRLALVLLEDLSRNTRGGRLLEERTAEMVVARCALAPERAAQLRADFEQKHSTSVYLDRVKQSCTPR